VSARTSNLAVAALLSVSLTACSWFTDFKEQPSYHPWKTASDTVPPRANPQSSVSVYGTAAPAFMYDHAPTPAAVEAMAGIPNPVSPDARSLNNGRLLFQINCAVCHGPMGRGDGTVTRYGMAGIGLISDVTKNRTDGYIFGKIRNGGPIMPSYDRIEESERWDIVNYLRELQGKLGTGVAIDTTHGRPGETGVLVPGASVTAPTRPAPYYHFIYPQAGAQPSTVSPPALATDTTRRTAPDSARPGGRRGGGRGGE
jgi:mono/diheme cytochrome c family protein